MTTIINTQHKDRLFCAIFRGKKELLSLYNAINETAYTDENALIVNTLDNAIYMTMKNDVSFLIYGVLNLYEHQSTWNPNMPLRDFLYVSQQIKKMVEEKGWDLYGSRLVKIPTPQAVVFYNGKEKKEDPVSGSSDINGSVLMGILLWCQAGALFKSLAKMIYTGKTAGLRDLRNREQRIRQQLLCFLHPQIQNVLARCYTIVGSKQPLCNTEPGIATAFG